MLFNVNIIYNSNLFLTRKYIYNFSIFRLQNVKEYGTIGLEKGELLWKGYIIN